jgi:hypothetical protein
MGVASSQSGTAMSSVPAAKYGQDRRQFCSRVEKLMKKLLFLACIFCAVAAVGQTGLTVNNAQPQMFEMPSHPETASQHDLATGRDLLAPTNISYAQGELPMWEVAKLPAETPLGDSARMLRKEHDEVKKAPVVWVN